MKFSFEKPKKSPEVEKPELESQETQEGEENLSDLEQQERFDAECAQEAEKLEVGIETLKAEIDALGGPEKFKEIFETKTGPNTNKNRAADFSWEKSFGARSAEEGARISKGVVIFGAILTSVEAFLIHLQNNDIPEGMESYSDALHVSAGIGALMMAGGSISFIKEKFKARRLEKQKKIETLKFKMTGVEVNEG